METMVVGSQKLDRRRRFFPRQVSTLKQILLVVICSQAVTCAPLLCEGFATVQRQKRPTTTNARNHGNTRLYNFLKDAFSKAFENDRNLSSDKRKQQYDDIYSGEEFDDPTANVGTLTETQKLWREKVSPAGLVDNPNSGGGVRNEMVAGTTLVLDLYLAGVPEKDPSNDLYGSRVNISNRDKTTGLSLPSTPSTSVTVQFLPDGVCRAEESSFTTGMKDGQWKLSDDGKVLRFSLDQVGFTRTAVTKGTIQNVAWTNEEERTTETSTTYTIPPGFVYGDVPVTPAKGRPGLVGSSFNVAGDGVLRVEQESGLFGISSKMVACGKFQAKRIQPDS